MALRETAISAGDVYCKLVLLLALHALPCVVGAQEGPIDPRKGRVRPMAIQTTARVNGQGPSPEYPTALRAARLEGMVLMRFLVNLRGEVDSIRVVATTHQLFADAARNALLRRKYSPALQDGRPAKQWIQERFVFRAPD